MVSMGWWGSRSGYVYVIEGEHGAVKVGHSVDPPQRLGNLQTGSPFPLRVVHSLFIESDAEAVEASARATLSRWLIRGEWFDVTSDVAIAAVYGAAARAGEVGEPAPSSPGVRNTGLARRFGTVALIFLPVWIAMTMKLPVLAGILLFAALIALTVAIGRNQSKPLSWAGAIFTGMAVSIVSGLLIGGLITKAAAADGAPLPAYDPKLYCTNITTLIGGGSAGRDNCISGEVSAEKSVRDVWVETPSAVRDRCTTQVGMAGNLGNYGALGGCIANGVGSEWLKGNLQITK